DQVGEPVTTAALGLAFEPEQPYTNPDGSPLEPSRDFAGPALQVDFVECHIVRTSL
ncbi:hypothetical protein H6B10_17405, partial [Gemmiger formicilis]|nr:hypothetical protein [Gemmiger formicilis]